MFAFKQDEKKFWENDKPVRVHRAEKSPNFGVRVFEQVAVFATMAEAKAWVSYALGATTTGRLSSSDPNLQNIPVRTEEGRRICTAFKTQAKQETK